MAPEVVDMNMPVEGVFHNLAIVKIEKTYAGQAQKIMNSLWGAGQMMFNKVMIVVGDNININDYLNLAKLVSENIDITKDVSLSKGPLDVLDHSAEEFSFGGKLGIDATNKRNTEIPTESKLDKNKIFSEFPDIVGINDDLLKLGISILIISFKKNKANQVKLITDKLFENENLDNIKFVVFVDENLDITSIKDIVWLVFNNIDTTRDIYLNSKFISIDGTRKTKKFDGFERNWPNIIAADDNTIKSIDEKWNTLGIGDFINSPSLKYKKMLFEGDATVKE